MTEQILIVIINALSFRLSTVIPSSVSLGLVEGIA